MAILNSPTNNYQFKFFRHMVSLARKTDKQFKRAFHWTISGRPENSMEQTLILSERSYPLAPLIPRFKGYKFGWQFSLALRTVINLNFFERWFCKREIWLLFPTRTPLNILWKAIEFNRTNTYTLRTKLLHSIQVSIENYNRKIRISPSFYILRNEQFFLLLFIHGFTCLLSWNDLSHNVIIDGIIELVFQWLFSWIP